MLVYPSTLNSLLLSMITTKQKQVVKALVLEVYSFQGPRFNTSRVQTIPWGHIPSEKPAIYPIPCRETSKGVVHGTKVYSVGMGLKGPAL
jgi:hypothetical protein